MSEEQGVGGKIPILQPDAVGGGGKRPTPHPTIRALSETTEAPYNESEEQGAGGKTLTLQPDAVGGVGRGPPHT